MEGREGGGKGEKEEGREGGGKREVEGREEGGKGEKEEDNICMGLSTVRK